MQRYQVVLRDRAGAVNHRAFVFASSADQVSAFWRELHGELPAGAAWQIVPLADDHAVAVGADYILYPDWTPQPAPAPAEA